MKGYLTDEEEVRYIEEFVKEEIEGNIDKEPSYFSTVVKLNSLGDVMVSEGCCGWGHEDPGKDGCPVYIRLHMSEEKARLLEMYADVSTTGGDITVSKEWDQGRISYVVRCYKRSLKEVVLQDLVDVLSKGECH